MFIPPEDAKTRFSNRVPYYHQSRPRYPQAIIDALQAEIGLAPDWKIADIGSGTGISSELFLRQGCTVFGVEPNADMRAVSADVLRQYPNFTPLNAQAEATSLEPASVDLVTAGQAFHWFKVAEARAEFQRILKAPGWVALFWNTRQVESTPFQADYEAMLREFSTDYQDVNHQGRIKAEAEKNTVVQLFGDAGFTQRDFPNQQISDFDNLKMRLLSSSYAPLQGHPNHLPMLERLTALFQQYQVDGTITIEYVTELYWGRLL